MIRDRLPAPILYISPYFEERRDEYYAALQGVREHGDLESWLTLFLDAVATQAVDAVGRAEQLTDLRERYRTTVQETTRSAANQLVDLAFEQPVLTARLVERRLDVARPSALAALRTLADLGILAEAADGPRGQLRWRAPEILNVLIAERTSSGRRRSRRCGTVAARPSSRRPELMRLRRSAAPPIEPIDCFPS
ncbi:MAG: hypothetical protein AAGD33_19815 [Actinomycetota bacterium]